MIDSFPPILPMLHRTLLPLSLVFVAFLLAGCLPNPAAEKVSRLEERVVSLERQLEAVRSREDDQRTLLPARISDLEQRVEETEKAHGGFRSRAESHLDRSQSDLRWLEHRFDVLSSAVISGQRAAKLTVTEPNAVPVLSRYGTFLLKLTGYDKTDDGYDLHLQLTNTTAFRIHQFRLYGDFGRERIPDADGGTGTRERIALLDAWENGLTDYEVVFDQVLEPAKPTSLVLDLPAPRLTDLEFIRLWIEVRAVTVIPPTPTETFTLIDAAGKKPSDPIVFPSEYGTFYLKILATKPVADGQELKVLFGNPLGIAINKIRFTGSLGSRPPSSGLDSPDERQALEKLRWRQSRHYFIREVRTAIKPMQWSEVTFQLPARSPRDLEHIEAQLELLEVNFLSGR